MGCIHRFVASARIPFTNSNVTVVAGAVGSSDISGEVLPRYVGSRIASHQDFVNASQTLTVGPVKGISLLAVGEQEGSPAIDLNLTIKRGRERLDK